MKSNLIILLVTGLGFTASFAAEADLKLEEDKYGGVRPTITEAHKSQKSAKDLGKCPDGHAALKDVPFSYGLFRIFTHREEDWNDADRKLYADQLKYEVVLGSDAFMPESPRFQVTCIECGYYYLISLVFYNDGTWIKSGRDLKDFSNKFSPPARILPIPPTNDDTSVSVSVKHGSVVSEEITYTLPVSQFENEVVKYRAWFKEHKYSELGLRVVTATLEQRKPVDPFQVVGVAGDIIDWNEAQTENGLARFYVEIWRDPTEKTFSVKFLLIRGIEIALSREIIPLVDFKEISLVEALRIIRQHVNNLGYKLRIRLIKSEEGDNDSRMINLQFTDVPVITAIKYSVSLAQMKYTIRQNTLIVHPLDYSLAELDK